MHNDAFLDGIEQRAGEIAASLGSPVRISCAVEGYEERVVPGVAEHFAVNEVAAPERAPVTPLTILVVDDDEDLRFLARRALSRMGHRVVEAAGGDEAIQLIESSQPDLVLLDLIMPPPDGFEVLKVLRASAETRSLPIVVLTAVGDEESARASFELGATDFLNKPFTPPQLVARVRSCFARAHTARIT
jgi:CheY-like chemotaxis protein